MPLSHDERLELQESLMRADLDLKVKQAFWETPKGLAAVVAATAVIIGAIAGVLGFKLGQTPPAPPQVIILQQPAAAAPAQK
jgi:hypothetical protein